jgi:hypothetical protein
MRNYDGYVVALFPELPGSRKPKECLAYITSVGFKPMDYEFVMHHSRPAKAKDYRELLAELKKQDFPVNLIQQASPIMHERRKKAAETYSTEK